MKNYLFFVAMFGASFFNSGCDKCSDVECFTPPQVFNFQLLDKDSGEDLVANGTFFPSEVKVFSLSENKSHLLQVSTTDSLNFVFTDAEIGWIVGEENSSYELRLGDAKVLPFSYESKKNEVECCTSFELLSFEMDSVERLFIPQQELFKLKI